MNITYLIAGLGNPGKKYEKTLHNAGFLVLRKWAERERASFQSLKKIEGDLARIVRKGNNILLLLPTTFMNNSGQSIQACLNYFKIPLENLLIVVDDVALEFGELRLRPEGTSGGHNGLKSVEEVLQTNKYSRLRVGVGGKPYREMDLVEHVLASFTEQQLKDLPDICDRVIRGIEIFLDAGVQAAMNLVNIKMNKTEEDSN